MAHMSSQQSQSDESRFYALGFFIWGIAASFFLYEFFLRTFVGTMSTDLIRSLKLSSEEYSLIGSAYYISYSLMQIPVGILVDRYGVRKLLPSAAAICALSVFMMAISKDFYFAFFARIFMGFGSSFGFVCLLAVTLNWFPKKHFGFFAGSSQFLGALGPILAGAPLVILLSHFPGKWRLVIGGIAVAGLLIALFALLFVRNRPKQKENHHIVFLGKANPIKTQLKNLLKLSQVWFIALTAILIYASVPVLGAVWGIPFLVSKGLDRSTAAFVNSTIWIGLAVGCPVLGRVSDWMKRRKTILLFSAALGVVIAAIIVYTPFSHKLIYAGLFFLLGLAGSGQNICFAAVAEQVPVDLRATALGLNNSAITLGGALFPPLISLFMRAQLHGKDVHTLPSNAFTASFAILPLLFIAAFLIILLFVRETFGKEQHQVHILSLRDSE